MVQRFNVREENTFTCIYQSYYPAIYFFCKKLLDAEQAKDVTAETFIDLWKGKRDFADISHIIAHLRTIARNKCIDRLRKQTKENERMEQWKYLSDTQEEILFSEAFVGGGIYQLISENVQKLPPFHRSIFALSYYQGLSNEEISQRLGIKNTTVRTKKAEALKLLRSALGGLNLSILLGSLISIS